MDRFIETITTQAKMLLQERSADILHAWHENIEEANANESKFPPLKVSIGATVDIETAKIETVLKFTTTYQSKASAPIEDPDQPSLFDAMKLGKAEIHIGAPTEGGES